MAVLSFTVVLALAIGASAQLEGRGFPDCQNGPLKNNTVCDKSAGTFSNINQEVSEC